LARRLFEGFTKAAGSAIRSFFARSHGEEAADIRRGGTPSVERAGLPYTLASHYGYDSLAEHLRIDQDLQARFTDYEEMDEYPEIMVSLDIYADDSCTPNLDREEAIWVTSKDKSTADELNKMLHDNLTVEDDIWGSARTLCKYGNNYGELLVNETGVVGINYLPPPTMRRVEDTKGNLLGFLQDIRGEFNITMEDFYALAQERGGNVKAPTTTMSQRNRAPGELTVFEDWEVIHWRLRGKHLRSVYGHAVIEPARWVWKRLALLEDALLIYKLERAPSRYAFYVDVGQLDAERGLAHVNRVKNSFTRKKFVNPCLTGDTLVHCLDGSMRSMKELADDGGDRWVYSFDLSKGKVVPGLAKNPRQTGKNVPVYRVVLDSGAVVRATGHHPFLMRDGVYRRCDQLKAGDRLMPILMARTNGGRGYTKIKQPFDGKQEHVHSLVARELWPELFEGLSDAVVHHKDRVKSNNDPSNLEVGERESHAKKHLGENLKKARDSFVHRVKTDKVFASDVAERLNAWRSRNPDLVRKVCAENGRKNVDDRKKASEPIYDAMMSVVVKLIECDPLITAEELVEHLNTDKEFLVLYKNLPTTQKSVMSYGCFKVWLGRQGYKGFKDFKRQVVGHCKWRNRKYERRAGEEINHRVVDVRFDGYEDVYNMDVDKYANFALVSNVFVHNSTGKLDMRYNPLCLHGKTEIQLLDGSVRTIEEMANAYALGEEQWVWSVDLDNDGKLRPGKVEWAGKTRRDAQLVRVTLDNGESVIVTPDHKMIRRDCSKVEAQNLRPGDSLMPFRRRISSKAKGETLEGYELVYCPKTRKSLYGHRVVASDLKLKKKNELVHHDDFNPLNNLPSNLIGMVYKDHLAFHRMLGVNGGEALKRARIEDPELDQRLRNASRQNITRYNQSTERREKLAEWNKERDQGRFIREYNSSEQHARDNEIRSKAMSELWANHERREKASRNMRIKFPLVFIEGVKELVRSNPEASMDDIALAAFDVLRDVLQEANTRKVVSIHRHMLLKMVREEGYDDFDSFRKAAIGDNHKVVSIEWLEERADTFTLTVGKTHTFALSAGIFVKNSHDEDFFIPVRDGKRTTEIDVIQGPDYTETDSLEYHRDKLVASLKIPKAYYGYGGEPVQGQLSTQDIRFARAIMRIQRCLRGGYRKACRVHLIAIGRESDKYDYQVHMTVPSSILELARMEVMNTTADLASRMGEMVSTKWLLVHLFKFTEEEAVKVMEEKNEERLKDGAVEAQIQKLQMSVDDETVSGGAPTLTEVHQFDRRLSQLIKAVPNFDWRREFEKGNRETERRVNEKFARLYRENAVVNKRMRELGGLLVDLRKTMRAEASL